MFVCAWEMLMQTNLLEGKFKHMPACLPRALAIWSWISLDNYRMSQQFVLCVCFWQTSTTSFICNFCVMLEYSFNSQSNMGFNFFIFSIFQLIHWEQHIFEHCDSKPVYGIMALPKKIKTTLQYHPNIFVISPLLITFIIFFSFSCTFPLHSLFWDEINF